VNDLDVFLPGIVAGDTRDFASWMSRAEQPLRRSLGSFAGQVDVEAVLQETLLRVWQVAPRFVADGRPDGLLRLAHRIARNLAISEVRKLRTTPVAPEVMAAGIDEQQRVDPRPSDPHLRRVIHECREKLPDKPKAALSARLDAWGGTPDASLAKRLGMQKNTFLQNFTRARKLLVECLRKHGVDIQAELT
jgi:RNA polymerase sigma factor (sigma-70 family)